MKQRVRQPISIRNLTTRNVVILFVAIGLMVAFTLYAGVQYEKSYRSEREHAERLLIARSISEQLTIYQRLVDGIATEYQLIDMLRFKQVELAEGWAVRLRSLIPNSIGLSLILPDGTILGERENLMMGEACIRDFKSVIAGEYIPQPPVHHENDNMRHFDVLSKVYDDGEIIGAVFVSFDIKVIEEQVSTLLTDDGHLLVKDGRGINIADAGHDNHSSYEKPEGIQIPQSDWMLHMMIEPKGMVPMFTAFAVGTMVLFTIVGFVFFGMTRRVSGFFGRDLELIKDELYTLRNGFRNNEKTISGLIETSTVMEEINQIMDQIENHQNELKHLSLTDEMTGQLNRRGFYEKVDYIMELTKRGTPCYLIQFDLDDFKKCNDKYGHAMGDQVLKIFSSALQSNCRSTDICARLGGDEFVVVVVNYTSNEIEQWYKNIIHLFNEQQRPYAANYGLNSFCGASAGAVRLSDSHGDIDHILKCADNALYQVKESGRGRLDIVEEVLFVS
ncbi:MAG: sensor domain-containing diguanylate cyclase [Pseudomonadota bacterium]